jgi:hypothetical protein
MTPMTGQHVDGQRGRSNRAGTQKSTLSFLTLMVPGESFSVTVNSVRLGMVFAMGEADRPEG